MKIRTAIFVVYVAASAMGLAVLMWFMLSEVRPRYVMAVRLNLKDAADVIAAALKGRTPLEARDALGGPRSFRVRLADEKGRIWFDSVEGQATVGEDGEIYPSASARGIARRMGSRLLDGEAANTELEVSTFAKVELAGGVPAQLVLSRSFRGLNAFIWSERKKLVGIALLVSGLMMVAGWWIAARLSLSLERLTVYVQQVRDRRVAPPPLSRAKEIAALARAFEEMRDALEGRQHVERYTQALAHEVKAPLAAIRGAAELLDEAMAEEQRRKFHDNIRGEAARIQQIVERLLELSSLEARKALGQAEAVSTAALLTEVTDLMRAAYAAGRVTLTTRSADAVLRGERVLLREALVNLLQNSLDFSAAGSEVVFEAGVAAGRVTFIVEDRGPGVPDYALPRVFERFYSLPRPGSGKKSTGLGLALVREIAHLHGGGVALANRTEGGARATLWMPVAGE